MTSTKRDGATLRRAELAQIHIAKTQLGLDEDTYRAMLWSVGRVKSSADLDWSGRKRVLDHLKASGFKPGKPKAPTGGQTAYDRQAGKIRALWLELAAAGALRDASDRARDTWILRQTGIQRVEWLTNTQCAACIEALKKWLARVGGQASGSVCDVVQVAQAANSAPGEASA